MMMHRSTLLSLLAAVTLMVSACAPAHQIDPNDDPLESVNRQIFSFNQGFDEWVLDPLVTGYRAITTEGIRRSIKNVFNNASEPLTVVSSLLQGDVDNALTSFWRFTLNTTFGLGGINDFAGRHGLKERSEDYGQALASWGVPSGPYLVLPIIGPSTLRDTITGVADGLGNPLFHYGEVGNTELVAIGAGNAFTVRDELDSLIDDTNAYSLDPYTTYRSMYIQRRNAKIRNQSVREY